MECPIYQAMDYVSHYPTKLREPDPSLNAIKLEFILKLKIKRNDWLLVDTCPQAANHCALFWVRVRKQPIVGLYFEFETVLKFYNLEACSQ